MINRKPYHQSNHSPNSAPKHYAERPWPPTYKQDTPLYPTKNQTKHEALSRNHYGPDTPLYPTKNHNVSTRNHYGSDAPVYNGGNYGLVNHRPFSLRNHQYGKNQQHQKLQYWSKNTVHKERTDYGYVSYHNGDCKGRDYYYLEAPPKKPFGFFNSKSKRNSLASSRDDSNFANDCPCSRSRSVDDLTAEDENGNVFFPHHNGDLHSKGRLDVGTKKQMLMRRSMENLLLNDCPGGSFCGTPPPPPSVTNQMRIFGNGFRGNVGGAVAGARRSGFFQVDGNICSFL